MTKFTEEHKRKISEALKRVGFQIGCKAWNKGMTFGPHSKETKIKMSLATKGIPKSKEFRENMKGRIPWNKGLKNCFSSESLLKISQGAKKIIHTKEWNMKMGATKKGSKSHFWKGGITPINKAIRNSFEYEEWRTKVFKRDLYTCQHCGEVGGYLQAEHLKPFSLFEDLRFELTNGVTLCFNCHKKTKSYLNNRMRREDYL